MSKHDHAEQLAQYEAAKAWMTHLDELYEQNTAMGGCPTKVENAVQRYGRDAVREVQRDVRPIIRTSQKATVHYNGGRANGSGFTLSAMSPGR